MYKVIGCLTHQHDLRLVALAAIVCLISSISAVQVWWRSLDAAPDARKVWTLLAGSACGFGVWATHFISTLAYLPGVPVTYDLTLVVASLLVAVTFTSAGLSVAGTDSKVATSLGSGAIIGLGIATMHYLGAQSMLMPGRINWDPALIGVSILIGMSATASALWIASRQRRLIDLLAAGGLLSIAVTGLHFTAMGAMQVVVDRRALDNGTPISAQDMALIIAGVGALLLGATVFLTMARARSAAQEMERSFHFLVEGVQDCAIIMLDPAGNIMNWNAGAERLKGYTAEAIVGQHFSKFYTEEDRRRRWPEHILETARIDGRFEEEGWRVRRDGSRFWALVMIEANFAASGELLGFAKITRDFTARRAAQAEIETVKHNFDVALSHMSQGLCLFDRDERIVFVNRRLPEIMGLPPSFYEPGTRFADLLQRLSNIRHAAGFGDRDADALYRMHIEKLRAREESANTLVLSGGQTISVRHSPVGDGSWVMTCEDITARYAVEQKIAYMSRHDGLTGLPNRLALEGFLHHALEAPTDATRLALVSIDLDRFKEINDQHGHAVGDAMLSALAARMRPLVGPGEICARIGGDEFVIVKQVQHRDELDTLIEPLMTEINAPIRLGNVALLASSSVGVALYPDDARDGDQLLNNAALAVSRAKATRRGSVCVFEAEMDEIARSRRKMAGELWTAIERDEFIVHYQVQKAVETGEITGYEALVRWEHPARGRVPPTEFIPVAEECGAILKLGEWVLRQACRDAVHWLTPFRVAVNLSPVQLGHADLVGMVKSVLAETGLPPERLELEITESTIVADKPRALHLLRQIKELGVSIAIDDFGTGYSSLDTLNSFPFDKIKIDRSFLMASDERPQSKSIVRAILALGRTLGMRVLAEGVETETQLGLLRQEGCFEGQGYLFGRPTGILACQR